MSYYQSNSVAAFASAGERGLELLLDELGCPQSPSDAWLFAQANQWRHRSPSLAKLLYYRWHSETPEDRAQSASQLLTKMEFHERHVPLLARHFAGALKRAPANPSSEFSAINRLGGVTRALARSGTNGVRIIANALAHPQNPDHVALMVMVLKDESKHAAAAVPALIALASLNVQQVYGQKAGNLTFLPLHPSSERSHLPLVIDALSVIRGPASLPFLMHSATNGHLVALGAIGEYGPTAQAYLPHLLPLTTNVDRQVRVQAEIAVRKISAK